MNLNNKITPEHEILIYCSHYPMDCETKTKVRSIVKGGLNWDYLIHMATFHKVRSILYFQLHQVCQVKIPTYFLTDLNDFYHKNAIRNLLMFGELMKILEILNSREIYAVPYKGPILAKSIYDGNITLREFSDIDIFVNEKDVQEVKEVLLSKGYYCCFKKIPLELYNKFEREYTFINKINDIKIEIQWDLFWKYFNFPNSIKDPFEIKDFRIIKIEELDVPNPSANDMFLILCIHSSEHLWRNLSLLADLNSFINSHKLDWSFVLKNASKLGVKRILFINILLLHNLYGFQVPVVIADCLKFDKSSFSITEIFLTNLFSQNELNFFYKVSIRIKLRENLKLGLKDILFELFIPSVDNINRIKLPIFLYYLYYILQPFQFAYKLLFRI
ncbi:MAG: nucleotidyltransferase family protein [Methanobacterium sp.]|nr:nucleotidyltransferase family protein [Methanobacterium sp.]